MKVLTVRQPWANLIISGAKDIENRTWRTSVRGRIAIHAATTYTRADIEGACLFMKTWIPRFSSRIFAREAETYVKGAIIGTVELVDCVVASDSPWFTGDFGFVLRDPRPLAEPIAVGGRLGFWDYDVTEVLRAH